MSMIHTWNTEELVAKDKAHLLHPVSNLKSVRDTGPLVLARGEGVYLWDTDGNRYIDGFAGLWNVNVGHGRHELAVAAAEQIDEVAFVPTFFGLAAPPAIELAAKLADLFPGPLNHIHFTSGGAESNETALKIARYYWYLKGQPDKIKIISRKMGYHGIAMGALAATGIPTYHEGFGPGVPGYVHVLAPYKYRNGDGLTDDAFVAKLVDDLEATIAREGAETIAAMIGEPVQGAGGVVPPPAGYWPAVAQVLKKHDILLIADEVITGFGRTGAWFGVDHEQVVPDMMVLAKGLTSGYVPMGAVIVNNRIAQHFETRMLPLGSTYAGHPLACAAALACLEEYDQRNLIAHAHQMGEVLFASLRRLAERHPCIGDVRGKGLFACVELVRDRASKTPLVPPNTDSPLPLQIRRKAWDEGLHLIARGSLLLLSPPLIVEPEHIDEAMAKLDRVLSWVEQHGD